MSNLQGAVVQTLLLSLLQSTHDSRNEFVLEERGEVGGCCFSTTICCHKENSTYGDLVFCDLMLQNPSVQKETSSLSHVAKTPAFFFYFLFSFLFSFFFLVEEIKVVIEWILINGCFRYCCGVR